MRNKKEGGTILLFPCQLFKGQSVSGGKLAHGNNRTKDTVIPINPIMRIYRYILPYITILKCFL